MKKGKQKLQIGATTNPNRLLTCLPHPAGRYMSMTPSLPQNHVIRPNPAYYRINKTLSAPQCLCGKTPNRLSTRFPHSAGRSISMTPSPSQNHLIRPNPTYYGRNNILSVPRCLCGKTFPYEAKSCPVALNRRQKKYFCRIPGKTPGIFPVPLRLTLN